MDAAAAADLFQEQRDRRPTAVIDTPSAGSTWSAGEQITFAGHGTDPDGQLLATAMTWELRSRDCEDPADLDCQVSVLQTWTGMAGGSFTAPDQAEPAYLELELTAVNDAGSHSTVVELAPGTVTLDLRADQEGLELQIGQVVAETPFAVELVEGATVTIAAPEPQQQGDTTYLFDGWSHGGDASQQIVVSGAVPTYTASFRVYDLMPRASIDSPSSQATWSAGDEISFSGGAANSEEPLAAEQLSWALRAEYCVTADECNLETLATWQGVAAGSFTAPDLAYGSTVLVLELTAEVGPELIDIETITLQPALVELTFATDPAGLELTTGWQSATAPFSLLVVQGATLDLSAPTQERDGQVYAFDHWQHGGSSSHSITAPAAPTTYTAVYTAQAVATGQLSGTVSCQAFLVAGAQVTVGEQTTVSDRKGQWLLTDVPVGSHTLRATPPPEWGNACMVTTVSVLVEADQGTSVPITLLPNDGSA
jgi:hypothetical protein